MRLPLLGLTLALSPLAWAQSSNTVTVYGPLGPTTVAPPPPPGSSTTTATSTTTTIFVTTTEPPQYTGLAAYNPVFYLPPPIPDNIANAFTIGLPNSASLMGGLSVPQKATFFGFSIEMSVATQLIGRKASTLNVQFLNLMSIMVAKAGAVHVRVGGNSQEEAFLVDHIDDGHIIEKDNDNTRGRTETPNLKYTAEFVDMLAEVAGLVNVQWYLGIPFNDTNFRFQIAELAQEKLEGHLLGLQAGNEPDLYGVNRRRRDKEDYNQWDYFGEFALLTQAYMADERVPTKKNLIAPSIQGGHWDAGGGNFALGLDAVLGTDFVNAYRDFLVALSVEHYPSDNCAVNFPSPGNPPKNPIEQLTNLLTHSNTVGLAAPYSNSGFAAQDLGLPFLMFETNTASCGGFPGVSDSFASALWAVDWALQLAHTNLTGALFHAGGQNVAYNPFTAPPTNESSFHQWTVGPVFYSAVVVAEALGRTNTSQVKDINANDNSEMTPGYAIYESGTLARLVLLNFMTDPSGARDYVATLNVGGDQFGEANAVPAQVKVKYLLAPSTAEKDNITWAGQTLGARFEVDGRWKGTESVQTVSCDQGANSCQIRVPAPGVALVFVSDAAQQAASEQAPVETFATTVVTKTANTVSIDPAVLATSNGDGGQGRGGHGLGGTSQGGRTANGAVGRMGRRAVGSLEGAGPFVVSVVLGACLL